MGKKKEAWPAAVRAALGQDTSVTLPYLAQKWYREGCSVQQIAIILNRPLPLIQKALTLSLPASQYALMQAYRRTQAVQPDLATRQEQAQIRRMWAAFLTRLKETGEEGSCSAEQGQDHNGNQEDRTDA